MSNYIEIPFITKKGVKGAESLAREMDSPLIFK
jgi:hypothetical protein